MLVCCRLHNVSARPPVVCLGTRGLERGPGREVLFGICYTVVTSLFSSFLPPCVCVFFLSRPFYLAVFMRSHVVFEFMWGGGGGCVSFSIAVCGNTPLPRPPPLPPLALPLRHCECDVTLAHGRPEQGIWLRRLGANGRGRLHSPGSVHGTGGRGGRL